MAKPQHYAYLLLWSTSTRRKSAARGSGVPADFSDEKSGSVRKKTNMIGRILFILIPVTAAAVGQMILKIGMGQVGEIKLTENLWGSMVKMATNPYVVGGLAFFGINAFLWLVVLSKEKLSFAYPMVAFAYVVTILLSKYVLHEDIPVLRWAGLATIIVGILMIAKSST